MMVSMDEEVLNPPERSVLRQSPEAACHPDKTMRSPEQLPGLDPAIHDPMMAKSLESAATEPMEPAQKPGETAVEPVLETEIIDDSIGKTLPPPASSDETLPISEKAGGASQMAGNQPSALIMGDRFRPLRPHARGGIGLVWVARDNELQRDVALKVIQPKYAERNDQRTRFVLEAEITGKLEHPGIVPVYSLGRDPDGRPYYAMRFIRGESLSAAIKRFHKARLQESESGRKREAWTWGVEFRQLLGSFLDVCDTIDYAHSRRVLHRDLKPANIMLGRYGETLVVDWGLAKVVGKPDNPPAEADGDFEAILAQVTADGSDDAEQGMAIGTPSYMSPEQANGLIDELGPASDVYSLGATLYELLTGQLAFPGEKITEILGKVRKGDFPRPRSVCRSLPAPLDAICCKAMALKPEDRFSSVRELARDIEHWLADEPVAAYPEGRIERLLRWFRRHRTWAYAAFATLVGICLVAIVAAAFIEGSRQREAEARREAEFNFGMAQDAVDDYLTNVSENTLLKEQDSVDIRNLRQELLQSALKYYQHFVNQRSSDPRLRQELANAYSRLGEITNEIASPHQALDWLGSAQTIWERLAADQPKNDDIQGHLAVCYLTIGKVQEAIGNLQGALKSLAQAHAILLPLAARRPGAYQARLAECYSKTGAIQARREFPDEALDPLEKARAILQHLIERAPDEIAHKRSLAEAINNLGYVHYKKHELAAALSAYEEVEGICQALLDGIKSARKPVWLLNRLAKTHYIKGAIHLQEHRPEQARQSYQHSLEAQIALVDAHPSVTEYHENLGKSYLDFGTQLHGAHQGQQALEYAHKSLEIFRELVRSHSDEGRYLSELALSWNLLGVLRDDQRQNLLAIWPFTHAVKEQERAVQISKDVDEYKSNLGYHLENLGEEYVILGDYKEGLKSCLEALERRDKLYKTHPNIRRYALEFAATRQKVGDFQLHAGEFTKAKDSYTEAREFLEHVAADAPDDAEVSGRVGTALKNEAVALAEQHKSEDAVRLLEHALTILTPLGTPATAEAQNREKLSEALWQLGRVYQALNQPANVAQVEARRKELWKGRPGGELATLALAESARAALTGYGNAPVSGPAKSILDRDLDLAAADLGLAVANGFKDLAMLKAHPEFEILQNHESVLVLLKRLLLSNPPAQPGAKNLKPP
jgi:serine/threonine-protein kinase